MFPTPVLTEGRAMKSHQALSVTVRQAGPGRPALKVRRGNEIYHVVNFDSHTLNVPVLAQNYWAVFSILPPDFLFLTMCSVHHLSTSV